MTDIEELTILVAASATISTEETNDGYHRVASHAAKLLDKIKPDGRGWYKSLRDA